MWLLRCGCHGDRKLRNHRICPKAPRTLSCIMVEMYLNRSWNFAIFVFGAAYVGCEASDEGFWNLACSRNWCSNLALHFCWVDACSAFWTLHASLLSQLLYEEKMFSLRNEDMMFRFSVLSPARDRSCASCCYAMQFSEGEKRTASVVWLYPTVWSEIVSFRRGSCARIHSIALNRARNRLRVDFGWDVTWLILPVVICLSQRLSHACLSTCLHKAKPRMAH